MNWVFFKLNKIFFYLAKHTWVFQETADTREDLQEAACQFTRRREHSRKEDRLQ